MFKLIEINDYRKGLNFKKEYNLYIRVLLNKALMTGNQEEWQKFITEEAQVKFPWQQVNLVLLESLELFLTEATLSSSGPRLLLHELCVSVFEFILKETDLLDPSIAKYCLYLKLLEVNFDWHCLTVQGEQFYTQSNLMFIKVKTIYFRNLCYLYQKTTQTVSEAELTLYIKLIKNKALSYEEAKLVIDEVPNVAQKIYYYALMSADLLAQRFNIPINIKLHIKEVSEWLNINMNVDRIRGELIEPFIYLVKAVELNYLKSPQYLSKIKRLLIKHLDTNNLQRCYIEPANKIIEFTYAQATYIPEFIFLELIIIKFLLNTKMIESEVPIGVKLNIATLKNLCKVAEPKEKLLLEKLKENKYYIFNPYQRNQLRLNIFLSEEETKELKGEQVYQFYLELLYVEASKASTYQQQAHEQLYEIQVEEFFSDSVPPINLILPISVKTNSLYCAVDK